jgi:hypothetical protein
MWTFEEEKRDDSEIQEAVYQQFMGIVPERRDELGKH